jgi:hypothetical protein
MQAFPVRCITISGSTGSTNCSDQMAPTFFNLGSEMPGDASSVSSVLENV